MLIGTDFELPIINVESKEPVSVVGLLGGTKDEPLSIGKGCARQEDNVMAEFTIPPATTFEEFISSVSYCIEEGNKLLQEINPNFKLIAKSSYNYSDDELNTYEALTFGCSASFNAYTRDTNDPPNLEEVGNLRSAGFHIHFGSENKEMTITDKENIVKLFDSLVVLPSLLIDKDSERRKLYGKAGDFRPKPYGLECRALGAGMMASFDIIEFVWEQVQTVVSRYKESNFVNNVTQSLVREAIDTNNVELAAELLNKLEIKIPSKCLVKIEN